MFALFYSITCSCQYIAIIFINNRLSIHQKKSENHGEKSQSSCYL